MKLLLDTHILIWWYLDQPQLPEKYVTMLSDTKTRDAGLALSVISLWEIAKLVASKKLEVTISLDQWFEALAEDPVIKILPLSGSIILESTRLGPAFPKDPADQLIAATARCHELRLLTLDKRIIESSAVALA